MRVPRDYSVVGYDNSISDALFEPALTSIEQNVDELSDAALSIMFRRLNERGADVVQEDAAQAATAQATLAHETTTKAGVTQATTAQVGMTDAATAQAGVTEAGVTGKNSGIEAQENGAPIQIILEPRMIEKNSVRILDC